MRRQASYSDSFLLVPSSGIDTPPPSRTTTFVLLNGTYTPALPQLRVPLLEDPPMATAVPPIWPYRITLFLFQGSLHVLCISAFETAFYFLYVNRSENEGILNTINTYYNPLVANCGNTWSNLTRIFVEELFTVYGINQTAVDWAGNAARSHRSAYNQELLLWSSMYSVICLAICGVTGGFARWKRWPVAWGPLLLETLSFVLLLGLYEIFFFKTIIYNYETLSTAELNQYLVDGLSRCIQL